jgi:hypothetical protein
MKTEDKAKELVESFAKTVPPVFFGVVMERNWQVAKQCALICVEEIIDVLGGAGVYSFADEKISEYWEEVKLKIQSF